jgi:hypothetical protein
MRPHGPSASELRLLVRPIAPGGSHVVVLPARRTAEATVVHVERTGEMRLELPTPGAGAS